MGYSSDSIRVVNKVLSAGRSVSLMDFFLFFCTVDITIYEAFFVASNVQNVRTNSTCSIALNCPFWDNNTFEREWGRGWPSFHQIQ